MKFFFRDTVAGAQEALALGSMYSPVDIDLRKYTHGALNVFDYQGDDALVVVKANTIRSVVAMVPFADVEMSSRFFLVEKFALGVIDTGIIVD